MAAAPLIDTHIWIWWIEGSADLRRADREALDALSPAERPKLSVISLYELSVLVEKKRYTPGRPIHDWLALAASSATIDLLQIGVPVARALFEIPRTFHRDPADRILVATARALGLPFLTYDEPIRRSGLVKVWPSSAARA